MALKKLITLFSVLGVLTYACAKNQEEQKNIEQCEAQYITCEKNCEEKKGEEQSSCLDRCEEEYSKCREKSEEK